MKTLFIWSYTIVLSIQNKFIEVKYSTIPLSRQWIKVDKRPSPFFSFVIPDWFYKSPWNIFLTFLKFSYIIWVKMATPSSTTVSTRSWQWSPITGMEIHFVLHLSTNISDQRHILRKVDWKLLFLFSSTIPLETFFSYFPIWKVMLKVARPTSHFKCYWVSEDPSMTRTCDHPLEYEPLFMKWNNLNYSSAFFL